MIKAILEQPAEGPGCIVLVSEKTSDVKIGGDLAERIEKLESEMRRVVELLKLTVD